MSGPGAAGFNADPAYEEWNAQERRIRSDYLAAVAEARRQYDIDVVPARGAYDRVERAAWQAYYVAGRANWQAYRAALAADPTTPPPTSPLAAPYPPLPDRDSYSGPWPAQPSFTPIKEGAE